MSQPARLEEVGHIPQKSTVMNNVTVKYIETIEQIESRRAYQKSLCKSTLSISCNCCTPSNCQDLATFKHLEIVEHLKTIERLKLIKTL